MPALAFVEWLAILATAGIGSAIAIFVWDRIQAGAWDFAVQELDQLT